MGRNGVAALLAASAFLLVTVISFAWAGNAGDDSTSSTEIDDVAGLSEVQQQGTGSRAGLTTAAASFAIDPTAPATIVGTVTSIDGTPIADASVRLFLADGDVPAGESKHTVLTQPDGSFEISAPVGCYVIRFDAPAGRSVVGGNPHLDVPTCVNATIVRIQLDAEVL